MKILNATRFEKELSGGSTLPWVIFAADENVEKPYVVKLFSQRNIEQQNAVAKEVYGNYLARALGNTVPEIALIDFSKEFIDTLSYKNIQRLEKVHNGYKFGSLYEPAMINYSPTLHKKHLQAYEIGNIYALDCLLYNVDRGRRVTKPNILMDDERMLLIDHEQCLHFADGQDEHFKMILEGYKNFQLDYPYQHHLFYSELKNLRASQKLHLFDEFCEYLTHLNTSDFRSTAVSLGNLGVWTGNHVRIYEYLCFLKGNVTAFQKALLTSIS